MKVVAVAIFSLVLLTLWSAEAAWVKNVKFSPLDPNVTNPSAYWRAIQNPIPEDYCSHPRFPVVPTPGPIAMDILHEVYPGNTSKPSSIWYKNLWGFEMDDYSNWGAVYPYPYVISPKSQNINIMYPGAPVNFEDNSRMLYGVVTPPVNTTPPIHNASYPYLVMSAAFDLGILISDAVASIADLNELGFTVNYKDASNNTVASLYVVKGSPFVNILCKNAKMGFGSKVIGVPPIIAINGNPPGTPVTDSAFLLEVAVGPTHMQGQFWHAFFDQAVTLNFPDNPNNPILLAQPYTGLFQVAVGDSFDFMGEFIETYRGVWAKGATVEYDIDSQNNQAIERFAYNKVVQPGRTNELAMLCLPHHLKHLQPGTYQFKNTTYWSVKGPMMAIIAPSWNLEFNLTSKGFGDDLTIDPTMKPALLEQLNFDYNMFISKCPGDNITGQGYTGNMNMELYAYVRDLAKYTDVSIISYNLGLKSMALNMTKHILNCVKYVLAYQESDPIPCEPPINNTANCVRDQLAMYYDNKWGGIVTGWYDRFAVDYCQGCDNPEGYNPFSNYGNAFYNDHHFQYGYLVKDLAWPLYLINKKGEDLGLNASQVHNLTKQALAYARDYANPDPLGDPFFTFLRHKDVFDGHSWAEGYDYSGRVLTWVNQQSGGEALNSYYAVYLLGLALSDDNLIDWGRLNAATEMSAIRTYQLLSNVTELDRQIPTVEINKNYRCMSILIGNGASGATYYGPNAQFECGISVLPVSPVTRELIDPVWAGIAYDWLQFHIKAGGACVYPNPLNMTENPCGGQYGPDWWGNEFACCPTNVGYPNNQWRSYPDWYPYMYIILAMNNTQTAWQKLQVDSLYKPTADLPFPYMNSYGYVVGYQYDLCRTVALFTVATHPQAKEVELNLIKQKKSRPIRFS